MSHNFIGCMSHELWVIKVLTKITISALWRHLVPKNDKFLQILNQRQILFKMSHQVTRYLKIWLFWFWLENRTWFAESNHLGQTSQIGKWLFSRLWVMWYLIGKRIWRWFRICKNFSFLITWWRSRAEKLIFFSFFFFFFWFFDLALARHLVVVRINQAHH